MGSEIVYCDTCGGRILEKEIQKGDAVTILNKNFCSRCKDKAIRENSGEMPRKDFANLVLPKEPAEGLPAQKEKEKSSTSHMRALQPNQPIVSRAGAPRHRPLGQSRFHGRGVSSHDGRASGSRRYGRQAAPAASSGNKTGLIIVIVAVAILLVILIVAMASK